MIHKKLFSCLSEHNNRTFCMRVQACGYYPKDNNVRGAPRPLVEVGPSKLAWANFFLGLAHLIGSYVEAINSPGAIPNVENAWNVFIKTKCDAVKKAGMTKYSAIMSELHGSLPLDGDEIRNSHNAAFAECENEIIVETAGLSTNTVEDCLDELQVRVSLWRVSSLFSKLNEVVNTIRVLKTQPMFSMWALLTVCLLF